MCGDGPAGASFLLVNRRLEACHVNAPFRGLALALSGLAWLGGCRALIDEGERVRLEGEVRRGPISPACVWFPTFPCDEPFSAQFGVYLGTSLILTFRSAADGQFSVSLPAGRYRLIPAGDAPIANPAEQVRDISVGPDSVTHVTLKFDTGIR